MSEIANLSKMLIPSARQPVAGRESNKNLCAKKTQNETAEMDVAPADEPNGENRAVANRDKTANKKAFTDVYKNAVNRNKQQQDLDEQNKTVVKETENPENGMPLVNQTPQEQPQTETQQVAAVIIEQTVSLETSQQSAEIAIDVQISSTNNTDIQPVEAGTPEPKAVKQQGSVMSEIAVTHQQKAASAQPVDPATLRPVTQGTQTAEMAQSTPKPPETKPFVENLQNQAEINPKQIQDAENNPIKPEPLLKQQVDHTQHIEQPDKQPVLKEVVLPEAATEKRAVPTQSQPVEAPSSSRPAPAPSQAAIAATSQPEAQQASEKVPFEGSKSDSTQTLNLQETFIKEVASHSGTEAHNEIQHVVSMEHAAEPSPNASLQAIQTPSRTGVNPQSAVTMDKPFDQIAHQVSTEYRGGEQSIRLTLTPADLGTVRITFTRIEDDVVGMLEVQKSQTRREIEQTLPQLISSIQESGVPLRRVELTQWTPGQNSNKDNQPDTMDLSQQREFGQHNSSNSSMSGQQRASNGQSNSGSGSGIRRNTIDYNQDFYDEGLNIYA